MRRFITVLLVINMLLFTGCTIPFFGKSAEEPPTVTDKQELISVGDNNQSSEQQDNEKSIVHTEGTPEAEDTAVQQETDSVNGTVEVIGEKTGLSDTQSLVDPATDSVLYASDYSATGDETGVLAAQSDSGSSLYFSEPRRSVTVYYQDGDGYLVPMTRWIEQQAGIARASMNLVIDSALNREELVYYGVYPVIPASTEILGIDVRDGIATIDFSRYLLNYDSALSERNIVASIVYTMTEFETIESVRILINGYPQGMLKYGTDLEKPLRREDVMINGDLALTPTDMVKVDVFLMKQANIGFTYPVPFSVVDTTDADDIPEILVKQLLDTKSEGGLVSEIPQDVSLLGASILNGIITLNFNENFMNYGGTMREEGILKQLAYTLRQCNEIRRMKIVVAGREVELPEGTDISGGLAIPITINDVIDR